MYYGFFKKISAHYEFEQRLFDSGARLLYLEARLILTLF